MADDSKLPNIGGNGFIWILLVAAGTLFVAHQLPLEGSRPAATERSIRERVGEQHVDARLWQDPFAVVANELAKSPELKPENCDRSNAGYKDIVTYCRPPLATPEGAPDLTLLVSLSGAPYSEDQEARRRRRYAVLAGLNAEGFVPDDPQHIGFYWPDADLPLLASLIVPASPQDSLTVQLPALAPASPSVTLPKFVPYEWLKPRPERPNDKARYQRILLLWFDEDTLAASAPTTSWPHPAPLQQYAKLLCPYLPRRPADGKPPEKPKVKILGPQLSTTLKAVVDEVSRDGWSKDDWSEGVCPDAMPPQFYVSDATVSDATLLPARFTDPSCLASNDCLSELFDRKSIQLRRLIATDDMLASAVRHELRLRGVGVPGAIAEAYARYEALVRSIGDKLGLRRGDQQHPPNNISPLSEWYASYEALVRAIGDKLGSRSADESGPNPVDAQHRRGHIALISEWDTLYGRALPDSMARCLGQPTCEPAGSDPFPGKDWLHPFKYLRGLDGQMPNDNGSGSSSGSKDANNKQSKDSKDSAKGRTDPSTKDRAEGQDQFDYLRRLGDRIQQLDAQLRRDGQNGIEAVGVLGSDVYDKLLVLQVLRPLLPEAWFFTTDLDALLLHPTAQTPTRNLLVASSFGLQLQPDIQKEIPPFRGSYQTADFLATRVAIRDDATPGNPTRRPEWSATPLIFEIGSTREFQFPNPDPKQRIPPETDAKGSPNGAAKPTPETEAQRCRENVLHCKEIHPPPSAMVPQLSRHAAIGLSTLALGVGLGLGLYVALSFESVRHRTWHRIDTFMRGANSNRRLLKRGLAALVGLAIAMLLVGTLLYFGVPPFAHWLTRDGQPMMALEGISVWPTIFLRLATLLLCIWLLVRAWQRLEKNFGKIAQDLHLAQTWQDVAAERPGIVGGGSPWIRLARRFGYRLPDDGAGEGGNVARFWRRYIYQGRWVARIGRAAAGVAIMAVLWVILVLIFGHPHEPTRGLTSFLAYKTVTLALSLALLILIFFVADATWLCWKIIKAFRTETAVVWPPRTLQEFSGRFDLPKPFLDDWIDLVFVSKRTKCITTLCYYPFLIIALMFVSRSPLFANYGRPIPDLIALGIGVLIVTACAVALRWSAEESRAKARRRLSESLILARGAEDGGRRASQLETLLRRVEELREGAFSPFSQQPMVRAMLLPLGGIGGTALLEYLLLPGFG